jgi:hypothetical protein
MVTDHSIDRIELRAFPMHRGKAHVLHQAALDCEEEVICFTDGDLAYSLDHLPLLERALAESDVAIGSRSMAEGGDRHVAPLRRLLGWGFNRLTRLILGLPYRDMQAGLKGFRRPALHRLLRAQTIFDFAFDVEWIYAARRLGLRIAEVPARPSADHADKPSKVHLLKDPCRMFLSLIRIRIAAARGRYG